ncbi:hypothetical protein BDU57DRAFT_513223 [Ampelomyces quisqualis]|uniref:Uncharacterized protein n=1 Tax=Ampelomyces quisqualis TaxID=50730 RepID=A0A6A5QVU8_AMPQU|nr:hypothetical protein BDU57DRAFT_513223 [Ampelomyces quisqualis]
MDTETTITSAKPVKITDATTCICIEMDDFLRDVEKPNKWIYPRVYETWDPADIAVVCWILNLPKRDQMPIEDDPEEEDRNPPYILHAVKNGNEIIGNWKPGHHRMYGQDYTGREINTPGRMLFNQPPLHFANHYELTHTPQSGNSCVRFALLTTELSERW